MIFKKQSLKTVLKAQVSNNAYEFHLLVYKVESFAKDLVLVYNADSIIKTEKGNRALVKSIARKLLTRKDNNNQKKNCINKSAKIEGEITKKRMLFKAVQIYQYLTLTKEEL